MVDQPNPGDWAVLGVEPGCPTDVARAAYHRRAAASHPDHHPDATEEERRRLHQAMTALNLAWARIEAADTDPWRPGPTVDEDRRRFDVPEGFGHSPIRRRPGRLALRLVATDGGRLAALASLADPAALVVLDASDRRVRDDHLGVLASLPGLTVLDLSGTDITDAALTRLGGLASLSDLRLADTALTDRATEPLSHLRSLVSLSLVGVPVTDEGVARLGSLPKLSSLNLRGTGVRGAVLDAMAEWPALHLLGLPRVDPARRRRFEAARPDVRVV
jgi:hypothetical protein